MALNVIVTKKLMVFSFFSGSPASSQGEKAFGYGSGGLDFRRESDPAAVFAGMR
jgi:hypothetical protein